MNEEELKRAYEELVQKYNTLATEFVALQQDNIVKRIQALCHIIENPIKHYNNGACYSTYSKEVLELADWHLKQLLAKNDESGDSKAAN